MASIDWRDSRAYIRFYDSGREPSEKKVSLDLDAWTRREVRQYKRELVVAYERGEWDPWTDTRPHRDSEIPTIAEALRAYIQEKVAQGKRGEAGGWTDATRKGKESVLWDWASRVGEGRAVTTLQFSDFHDYVHRQDIALATRKGYRTHLMAFRAHLEREGYDMPDKVPPLKRETRPPEYLSEDELHAVCEAHCEVMEDKAGRKHVPRKTAYQRARMTEVFRFCFYQGLRRGEVVNLRVGDIDTDGWTLRIGAEQKGKRHTTTPVTPPARPVILPFLEKQNQGRVFGYKRGKRLTNAFKEAVEACGVISDPERVDRLKFHSLRHSCAMYWKRKGASLADIRDLLRHQSVRTTELYERMDPAGMSERFEELA